MILKNKLMYDIAADTMKNNGGHCPCKFEICDETKCMCQEFKNQIAHKYEGACPCGIYAYIEYPVITLCGSTKFKEEFEDVARLLTLQGYLVFMPHVFHHVDGDITEETKLKLDKIHKQKIQRSDCIYVINKNGYIGESTRAEIEYAKSLNKIIFYLEPLKEEI